MQHETYLTVRFGETDLLGHVNNANYFSYLEEGRVDLFKALSTGGEYQYNEWQFTLATIKCDFLAQTYFAQDLTIVTKVSHIGNKSFTLQQPIFDRHSGTLLAQGESVIVCFDFREQVSTPIPDALREKLNGYFDPAPQ